MVRPQNFSMDWLKGKSTSETIDFPMTIMRLSGFPVSIFPWRSTHWIWPILSSFFTVKVTKSPFFHGLPLPGTRPPVYLSQQRVGSRPEGFQALAPVAVSAFLEATATFEGTKNPGFPRDLSIKNWDLSINNRDLINLHEVGRVSFSCKSQLQAKMAIGNERESSPSGLFWVPLQIWRVDLEWSALAHFFLIFLNNKTSILLGEKMLSPFPPWLLLPENGRIFHPKEHGNMALERTADPEMRRKTWEDQTRENDIPSLQIWDDTNWYLFLVGWVEFPPANAVLCTHHCPFPTQSHWLEPLCL